MAGSSKSCLPPHNCLSRLNSQRRRTLRALLDIERYPLAVGQGLEAATLNRRVMHEDIVTTVLWRNEAVALVGVKPLYRSCSHGNTSVWLNYDGLQFIPESNIAGVTAEKTWRNFRTEYKKCAATCVVYTAFAKKAAIMMGVSVISEPPIRQPVSRSLRI